MLITGFGKHHRLIAVNTRSFARSARFYLIAIRWLQAHYLCIWTEGPFNSFAIYFGAIIYEDNLSCTHVSFEIYKCTHTHTYIHYTSVLRTVVAFELQDWFGFGQYAATNVYELFRIISNAQYYMYVCIWCVWLVCVYIIVNMKMIFGQAFFMNGSLLKLKSK